MTWTTDQDNLSPLWDDCRHPATGRTGLAPLVRRPAGCCTPVTWENSPPPCAQARPRGSVSAPLGGGHSFTPVAVTDGVHIRLDSLDALERVAPQEDGTTHVTVGAGIRLGALNTLLAERGLAMRNLGDIDKQSIAGAISTGTHGTGAQLGGLATQVVGARLVTATGEVVETSRDAAAGAVRAGPARPGQRRRARRRDARGGPGVPPGGPRGAVAAGRGPRAAGRPGRPGREQRPLRVLLVPAHAPGADQAQQPRARRRGGPPAAAARVGGRRAPVQRGVLAGQRRRHPRAVDHGVDQRVRRARAVLPPLHGTVRGRLRLPAPGEVPRDGVRGAAPPAGPRAARDRRLDRVERRARAVPRRGAVRRGGRPVALDGARPRDRVRRGAPVPAAAVRAVLRGRRADRRPGGWPAALGQDALARGRAAGRAVPPLRRRPARARRGRPRRASSATRTWTVCWGPVTRLAA